MVGWLYTYEIYERPFGDQELPAATVPGPLAGPSGLNVLLLVAGYLGDVLKSSENRE